MSLVRPAVTALILVFALAGCVPTPEPTPESSPASEPEATSTDVPVVNDYLFTGEVTEQTHTIAEMDAIKDLVEFANLPYADRLAYAIAKRSGMAYSTPDNDTGMIDHSSIPPYYWQTLSGVALNDGDTLEGAKIASANEYYAINRATGALADGYQAAADSIKRTGGEGVSMDSIIVYEASGALQSGTDRDGNAIDFLNVTSYVGDGTTGERRDPSITDQAIRQVVKLLDGTIVIFYPRGYGIEGQQSPIEGGIY